jgi:hypothetical protein
MALRQASARLWSARTCALALSLATAAIGCQVNVEEGDDLPPTTPRGVYSITGDREVTIRWIANGEPDLDGYYIWRSRDPKVDFVRIATVSARSTQHVDIDVQNGRTYYYAVSAFDRRGNESDLSPEHVEDTPRPEGQGVTLHNYRLNPSRAGFTFSAAEAGPTHWDRNGDDLLDRSVDVFFGFDTEVAVPYLYSDHDDLFMQDLGYHDDMSEVDVAPTRGYTTISVEMIEGHVYGVYTPDGHYAKIRVRRVSEESLTFDWAYQLQRDNPDLAPRRDVGSVTRGRPRR